MSHTDFVLVHPLRKPAGAADVLSIRDVNRSTQEEGSENYRCIMIMMGEITDGVFGCVATFERAYCLFGWDRAQFLRARRSGPDR